MSDVREISRGMEQVKREAEQAEAPPELGQFIESSKGQVEQLQQLAESAQVMAPTEQCCFGVSGMSVMYLTNVDPIVSSYC